MMSYFMKNKMFLVKKQLLKKKKNKKNTSLKIYVQTNWEDSFSWEYTSLVVVYA